MFLDLFFAVFCKAARVVHFWVLLSPSVLVEAMPLNFKKEEGLLRCVKGLSQYAWRNVPTEETNNFPFRTLLLVLVQYYGKM